jgi:hypothetical protein
VKLPGDLPVISPIPEPYQVQQTSVNDPLVCYLDALIGRWSRLVVDDLRKIFNAITRRFTSAKEDSVALLVFKHIQTVKAIFAIHSYLSAKKKRLGFPSLSIKF